MGFFEDNFGEGSKKAPSSHHIKWEYISVDIRTLWINTNKLSELGDEGWELCAFSDNTNVAVFKRPKYDYN